MHEWISTLFLFTVFLLDCRTVQTVGHFSFILFSDTLINDSWYSYRGNGEEYIKLE